MRKRLLSILLAVVLVFGLLPGAAFAADTEGGSVASEEKEPGGEEEPTGGEEEPTGGEEEPTGGEEEPTGGEEEPTGGEEEPTSGEEEEPGSEEEPEEAVLIEKIDVYGFILPELSAGNPLTAPALEAYADPEEFDGTFEIAGRWLEDDGSGNFVETADTVFVRTKKYAYGFSILPKSGYTLKTGEGEAAESTEIKVYAGFPGTGAAEYDGIGFWFDEETGTMNAYGAYNASAKEVLGEINIDLDLSKVQVDTPWVDAIPVWEGDPSLPYTVSFGDWTGEFNDAKFAGDNEYTLPITVSLKDGLGYVFGPGTTVNVNGITLYVGDAVSTEPVKVSISQWLESLSSEIYRVPSQYGTFIVQDGQGKERTSAEADEALEIVVTTTSDGYRVKYENVSVVNANDPSQAVDVFDNGGSFGFVMPDYPVVVRVDFQPLDTPIILFEPSSLSLNTGEETTVSGKVSITLASGEAVDGLVTVVLDGRELVSGVTPENGSVAFEINLESAKEMFPKGLMLGNHTLSAAVGVGKNHFSGYAETTLNVYTDKKEETPEDVTFTATGSESGKLGNVEKGMQYSIDGGTNFIDIDGSNLAEDGTVTIRGLSAGSNILVRRKGDGYTSMDSENFSIALSQAEAPEAGSFSHTDCTTEENNDGTISGLVPGETDFSFDEISWNFSQSSKLEGLKPGIVYLRKSASGATLASDIVSIEILPFGTEYTITFEPNGGIINDKTVPSTYKSGEGVKLPSDVTREGKEFGGWCLDPECEGESYTEISATMTGDKKFYANWEEPETEPSTEPETEPPTSSEVPQTPAPTPAPTTQTMTASVPTYAPPTQPTTSQAMTQTAPQPISVNESTEPTTVPTEEPTVEETTIETAPPDPTTAPEPTTQPDPETAKKKLSTTQFILWLSLGFVVVAIGLAIVIYVRESKKEKNRRPRI